MAEAVRDVGVSALGKEREALDKLLKFIDDGTGVKFIDAKRGVRFKGVKGQENEEEDTPRLTQRVKTFYVESWPEVIVKKGDNIIRPRSSRNLGGTPITVNTAVALRQITFGSSVHSFSREWKRCALLFQDISSGYSWGIQTRRCGAGGLVMCIQAYLLKHLLFEREYISNILVQSCLRPNEFERRRALISAMSEILWKAGDKRRSCVCLTQENRSFQPDYRLRDDGITEKLQLFEFKKFSDLNTFIRRNIEEFSIDGHPGCVLFLYSVILSATIYKLQTEMCITEETRFKLLSDNEEATQALTNLLLTGHAIHNLHNGNVMYNTDGKMLSQPLVGIRERNDVGFLYWERRENDDDRTEVGSMLKTPRFPIWVTSINSQPGLLFSTNLDLVSDWRVENRFVLHYYTGLPNHPPCPLHIETRFGRHALGRTRLHKKEEEEKIPQLEKCIMTKWYGAAVDWPDIPPFY